MLFDKEKVIKIIKKFNESIEFCGNYQNLLPIMSKKEIIDGIGNIAVIYNGDAELTKKICLLGIRTHNRISIVTKNNVEINKRIISNLNDIMEEFNYSSNEFEMLNITQTEFFSMQKKFDMVLIIGNKKDYLGIFSHLTIKSIFYQFGEYNILLDEDLSNEQKNILKEIDKYAYEHDYIINYFDISRFKERKEEIDEIIHNINFNCKNQSISIFTTIQEHSYYFISELCCSDININCSPIKKIEFDETEFVCKKNVHI